MLIWNCKTIRTTHSEASETLKGMSQFTRNVTELSKNNLHDFETTCWKINKKKLYKWPDIVHRGKSVNVFFFFCDLGKPAQHNSSSSITKHKNIISFISVVYMDVL